MLIRHLIRSRTFDNFRFLEKYWPVVLDGTGVHAFSERHCEHDLVCRRKLRDGKEQTIYYHKILEAKLVVGPLVLSIGTEFIENEDEHVLMQLYLSWNPYARKLEQSIKNTSSKLLVSLTEHSISSEDVKYIEMHYILLNKVGIFYILSNKKYI